MELLVVIAIIGVLVALLLPAVQQAREAARRMACGNNLKQYGIGIHTYHDVWKAFPPGSNNPDGVNFQWQLAYVGWQARILPQMEQGPLFDKILWDQNAPIITLSGFNNNNPFQPFGWGSLVMTAKGQVFARQVQVPYARCPSDPWAEDPQFAQSNYTGSLGSQLVIDGAVGNLGPCDIFATSGVHYEHLGGNNADHGDSWDAAKLSGLFSRIGTRSMKFASLQDGASNVILVGEILPGCHSWGYGWWDSTNGAGNAHASTSCPINLLTTCAASANDAASKNYPYPNCVYAGNSNLSWGFKSRHPQGAQFVYADGSVHFLLQSMNYTTYQRLGGRRDGQPLDSVNP